MQANFCFLGLYYIIHDDDNNNNNNTIVVVIVCFYCTFPAAPMLCSSIRRLTGTATVHGSIHSIFIYSRLRADTIPTYNRRDTTAAYYNAYYLYTQTKSPAVNIDISEYIRYITSAYAHIIMILCTHIILFRWFVYKTLYRH